MRSERRFLPREETFYPLQLGFCGSLVEACLLNVRALDRRSRAGTVRRLAFRSPPPCSKPARDGDPNPRIEALQRLLVGDEPLRTRTCSCHLLRRIAASRSIGFKRDSR